MLEAGTVPPDPNVSHRDRLTIVCIALGVFASVASTSMLAVAFPSVIQTFGITWATLQWRNMLFFSIFATGLPLFGHVADKVDPRRQFLVGLALFIAAAGASALAPSWPAFLAAQAAQGLADAVIVPAQMRIIRIRFPHRLGWAFGWFGATLSAATLAGPAGGGFLLQHYPWPALFVGLGLVALTAFAAGATVLPSGGPSPAAPPGLPWASTLSLLVLILSLEVVLAEFVRPLPRLAALGLAAGGAAGLVVAERHAAPALFPAGMWRNRAFLLAASRMFLLFLGANTLALFGPGYLRDVHHLQPQTVGLLLVAQPIVSLMIMGYAGRAADRAPRACVAAGLFLSTLGTSFLAFTPPPTAAAVFAAAFALVGLGATIASPALDKLTISAVPEGQTGAYMGIFQMFQHVSGGFAGVIMGSLVVLGGAGAVTWRGFQAAVIATVALQALALATMLARRAAALPGGERR